MNSPMKMQLNYHESKNACPIHQIDTLNHMVEGHHAEHVILSLFKKYLQKLIQIPIEFNADSKIRGKFTVHEFCCVSEESRDDSHALRNTKATYGSLASSIHHTFEITEKWNMDSLILF